jgi:hypothetical protein
MAQLDGLSSTRSAPEERTMRGALITCIAVASSAVVGWWFHGITHDSGAVQAAVSNEMAKGNQALRVEHERSQQLEKELARALRQADSNAPDSADTAQKQALTSLQQSLEQEKAQVIARSRELEALRREVQTQAKAASGEDAIEELKRSLGLEHQRADALARDLTAARREIQSKVDALIKAGEEASQAQKIAERAGLEVQQEQEKAGTLARDLAAARRETGTQTAALEKAADRTAETEPLTELREALRQSETEREALVRELRSQRAVPSAKAEPESDKPVAARQTPAAIAPAPETPADTEARRLVGRARQLLDQRNISAARSVLEHAAEAGNAQALFALAETYDPHMLAEWGTIGMKGDVAKAQELYTKALAGGLQEADARLKRLHP